MESNSAYAYQEDNVKDRETLENVGEGRLEVQLGVGEHKHTEDVAWNRQLLFVKRQIISVLTDPHIYLFFKTSPPKISNFIKTTKITTPQKK